MGKYRILEIPQPDESNKYQIQILELKIKRSSWYTWNNENIILKIWHQIDEHGYAIDFDSSRPTPPPLSNFDTLKEAKEYLEYLKKAPKVVYTTA